jgi:hypothetical protein
MSDCPMAHRLALENKPQAHLLTLRMPPFQP